MPAKPPKSLTPRHEAILAFILANPRVKRRDVAREFGVSEAWLSTIVHSDAFQAKLRERTDEVFSECLVPLTEKISSLAEASLERLAEKLPAMDSEGLFRTAEMTLKMAGYGSRHTPSPTVNLQQNFISAASPEQLRLARERLGAQRAAPPPLDSLRVEGEGVAAVQEVSA